MSLDVRREPLLLRTLLTGIVTALLHLAVLQGWISVASVDDATVAGIVDVIGALVAAFWARGAVTPAHDPVLQETVSTRLSEVEARGGDEEEGEWGADLYEPTTAPENTLVHPETVDNLTTAEPLPAD